MSLEKSRPFRVLLEVGCESCTWWHGEVLRASCESTNSGQYLRTGCEKRIHRTSWRNCLKIPDKLPSELPGVVRTEPEAPFRRLECHQIHTLEASLAIFQTVSEDEFSEVHTQHSPDPMRYASPDWGRAHLPHRAGAWYPPPALLLLFYVKIHISLTDIHILREYTVFIARLRDRCARGRRTATCPPSRPGPATSNPPPSAFPWAGGRR